ncbi:MAG: S1 RNA-binding domain-containing protein, partial [Acidobacteriia bacterium]|nr:S1 RNA-binding domain-containing protein [Terriglobia bacterium]
VQPAAADQSAAPADPLPEGEEESAASPQHPGTPAMPAMPGEPADDDFLEDDDEIEIPEDVGYDQIVKTSDAEPAEQPETAKELLHGTVVSKRHDGVFVDIGQKAEAFLPFEPSKQSGEQPEIGDSIEVIVTGQSHQGYLQLSSLQTQRPSSWFQLEAAFNSGSAVLGKVIGITKGGLSVDVGVRAFMPASRSGERSDEGLQALVGQEIRARIVQFDEADRNVVLDRRAVLNEERHRSREEAIANLSIGETVPGTVRSLREFGAFVDIGGIDGLLHISDIAWRHIKTPGDELHVGQKIQVKILKIDRASQKVGVGLKQTLPEPWSQVADRIFVDETIEGTVTKLKEFGAFVEVLPGVEGLVRISDLSFTQRVRHPSELVRVGDVVKVLVKNVDVKRKRIGLSLKEAMGDPWKKLPDEHPVDSVTTGTVRKIMHFGAFVNIAEGVDALLHISDITSDRRLNSPAEILREGQDVRVKILEINLENRKLRVGMKQLEPTEVESAMSQMAVGEILTGRIAKIEAGKATVEIGDGVTGVCSIKPKSAPKKSVALGQTSDLGSLKSMLESAWKGSDDGGQDPEAPAASAEQEPLTSGSIHTFRVERLDKANGVIELTRV